MMAALEYFKMIRPSVCENTQCQITWKNEIGGQV